MTEFLKIILILVALYYAFKFGIRLLLPYVMKKMVEKLLKNTRGQTEFRSSNGRFYYQTFSDRQQKTNNDKGAGTGKVRVEYVPPKEENRKGTATAGEFIEFEEVK